MKNLCDQRERRGRVLAEYRKYMEHAWDGLFRWNGREERMNPRELFWHCMPLLEGSRENIATANHLLGAVPLEKCHFSPFSSMQILLHYGNVIDGDAKSRLEDYIVTSLEAVPPGRHQFPMYNDNFASIMMSLSLLAGEYFDRPDLGVPGVKLLDELTGLFGRCGSVSEYGSNTYTAVNAAALAEAATFIDDSDLRSGLLKCEEMMWRESVACFHKPSGRLAGPYSRAYWIDSLGHAHLYHTMMYLGFGSSVFINPLADLFPPRDLHHCHLGYERLMWPNVAWIAIPEYHIPEYLQAYYDESPFPREVIRRAEGLPSKVEGVSADGVRESVEFPGWSGRNTTYMTGSFSLGTGSHQYHEGGLSDSFYITYKRRAGCETVEDSGVVFSRYIFNDKEPGKANFYDVYGAPPSDTCFRDEGRKWGLQHKDCSLISYKPKPFERHRVSSLKLSLIFPTHYGELDSIYIGRSEVYRKGKIAGALSSEVPQPVYVFDGEIALALIPLNYSDRGRSEAVRIEFYEQYCLVSFYNYLGDERVFSKDEIDEICAGFICHVKERFRYPEPGSFIDFAEQGILRDFMYKREGAFSRRIEYSHPSADLKLAYSPSAEGIITSAVNGSPCPENIFSCTGMPINQSDL